MISIPKPKPKQPTTPAWHETFLKLLPTIESYANAAFGQLDHDARTEAVAEAVGHAMIAIIGLVDRGKDPRLFPGKVAHFAALRVKAGRLVAGQSAHDALSPMGQQLGGFAVHSLDDNNCDADAGWKAAVAQNSKHSSPADTVAFRLDFDRWLHERLSDRDKHIAERLAVGDRPGQVARKFKLSPSMISKLRRQMRQSWDEFEGEDATDDGATLAAA